MAQWFMAWNLMQVVMVHCHRKRALANVEMGSEFKNTIENGKNLYEAESNVDELGKLDSSINTCFKPNAVSAGFREYKANEMKTQTSKRLRSVSPLVTMYPH